jgi:D-beta-D-heptose 7-phosphate kinase/D-beta-D-heptose 1-phosphate adenosyltransferase
MPSTKQGPILVFGDSIIDHTIKVKSYGLDQTSSVPASIAQGEGEVPGGAGNAVMGMLALGLPVVYVGMREVITAATQYSYDGMMKRHQAAQLGELTLRWAWHPEYQPYKIHRLVDQYNRLQYRWGDPILDCELDRALIEQLNIVAKEVDPCCVVISDYGKGAVTAKTLNVLATMVREWGCPCIIDPHENNAKLYPMYFREAAKEQMIYLMPNLQTFAKMLDFHQYFDLNGLKLEIDTKWEDFILIITNGDEGLHIYQNGAEVLYQQATRVTAVDSCGASDAVAAGWAYSQYHRPAEEQRWQDVAREMAVTMATLGGRAVTKPGTDVVWLHELYLDMIRHHNASKMVTMFKCLELCKSVRLCGGYVSVTNGVFDILHNGHRKLLDAAGEKGKFLIVLVNSDASAKRLKGEGRPIQELVDRMIAVAAHPAVDAVLPFASDTPAELIEAIKPDDLFKDARRDGEEIPGANYAGCVHFVEPTDDSTTETVAAIRKA